LLLITIISCSIVLIVQIKHVHNGKDRTVFDDSLDEYPFDNMNDTLNYCADTGSTDDDDNHSVELGDPQMHHRDNSVHNGVLIS
jgi:hypothetical protein